MPWTQVTKPTDQNWTDVAKPSESSIVTVTYDAQPFGLLIAITSVVSESIVTSVTSGWGDVPKPTVIAWTNITKPTD